MFLKFLLQLYYLASLVALSAVITESHSCRRGMFPCTDGACISISQICNRIAECSDGADEADELCNRTTAGPRLLAWNHRNLPSIRVKRQVDQTNYCRLDKHDSVDYYCSSQQSYDDLKICEEYEPWGTVVLPICKKPYYNSRTNLKNMYCRNGKWDYVATCESEYCKLDKHESVDYYCSVSGQIEEFRICGEFESSGSIVLPVCKAPKYTSTSTLQNMKCTNGKWDNVATCKPVAVISTAVTELPVKKSCRSNEFKCNDGFCINEQDVCNGLTNCAGGEDENNCANALSTVAKKCVLPPYPKHGTYVANVRDATPGQSHDTFLLNVTCQGTYVVLGHPLPSCWYGFWSPEMPKCVRGCALHKHPSVEYHCQVTGLITGYKKCSDMEPSGTVVLPECKAPNYYSDSFLPNMRCNDGQWSYVAICKEECGRLTPEGTPYVINGRTARRGELPWHAGIYTKRYEPYMQICGGSLVSNMAVLSAAHCFWTEQDEPIPASNFLVALGKLFRPWNNPVDTDAQKSDVDDIKYPDRFNGNRANFQADIALVILKTFIEYQTHIRPICLDFGLIFDERQLSPGNLGKVAGWGLTAEDGEASQILQVIELPYVDINVCRSKIPATFLEYLTSDKICAGFANGTSLCKGDSGGGLAFPEKHLNGVTRYYLRGIVSTAPKKQEACNSFSFTTFTQVRDHEPFYRKYA